MHNLCRGYVHVSADTHEGHRLLSLALGLELKHPGLKPPRHCLVLFFKKKKVIEGSKIKEHIYLNLIPRTHIKVELTPLSCSLHT